MKARPILFSGPMIRALLDSRKTQTRRIVNPQPQPNGGKGLSPVAPYHTSLGTWTWVLEATGHGDGTSGKYCPYGQSRDLLVVKESAWMWCERRPNGKTKAGRPKWRYVPLEGAPIFYQAAHHEKPLVSITHPETGNQWGWRLKLGRFLPRSASRLTLKLTEIRVERLQDISEADAIAEGIEPVFTGAGELCGWLNYEHSGDGIGYCTNPVDSYASLWRTINGPGSWQANPWVWTLGFCVHQKNVDVLLAERGQT